jgi:antitoxin VapB
MTASTVFTNNRTQAVRLPADVRFPAETRLVNVRVVGQERIIAPLNAAWDSFFLDGPQATDDFMAERASQEQPPRDSF